ncbi:hypothetical protein [Metabacillus sp. SLBN-84]
MILWLLIAWLIAAILAHQGLKRHLEAKSRMYANDAFLDQYFEKKSMIPSGEVLQLKGHRLIHRRPNEKRTINLYQVERVSVRYFRLAVGLKNGDTLWLPLWFDSLPYIYAILKYHRPDESRSALTTRKP